MFGSEIDRYSKDKEEKQKSENIEEDDLESYLQQRNAAIGEKTKSLKDSEEEKAMSEYMRLRSKTYGEPNLSDIPKMSKEEPDDDLDSYLAERNETMGDELEAIEDESELEAYARQRRQILDS